MEPIDLTFLQNAPGVVIKGEIFDSKEAIVLSEDLLEISSPSGRIIDVGWHPEHDPKNGCYKIILYRGHTGYPLQELTTTDANEAVELVADLVGNDTNDGVYDTSASVSETEVVQYA